MKIQAFLFTFLLVFIAGGAFSQENKEDPSGTYGAEITLDGAVQSSSLTSASFEKAEKLKVKGEINEVCQMKGCWMTMAIGNEESMRITFKDYGFFVPLNASGREAIIEGELTKEMVDVETLQHYAEDAGKSEEEIAAITEPEEKLTFVAEGVVIL